MIFKFCVCNKKDPSMRNIRFVRMNTKAKAKKCILDFFPRESLYYCNYYDKSARTTKSKLFLMRASIADIKDEIKRCNMVISKNEKRIQYLQCVLSDTKSQKIF